MKKLINKLKSIVLGTYYNLCNKHNILASERLVVCNNCKERIALTKNIHLCDQCGCILESKARVKIESCPLNKW